MASKSDNVNGSAAAAAVAAQEIMPPLVSVALLIDELKNDDVSVRLNSFQKLDIIARALGDARTRAEFLPFLCSFIGDDEEEILITLAGKLSPSFLPLIGGLEYIESILLPLKLLASVDETAVNDASIASLTGIIQQCSDPIVQQYVLPMVESLATAPQLASKRSACPLIPAIIIHVQAEQQTKLLLYVFVYIWFVYDNLLVDFLLTFQIMIVRL
jgi:serine/threonine-protein phosphatase 2A regulatory subunit A